ncbi:response regulator [Chloroflexi bacterium TSY]|nr:response regulator [Chloroflexi bacterium TSY]
MTRQLLAYTGQGAFVLEAVDINQLILDNSGLLDAVLPKNSELQLQLSPDLSTIEIDRGHAQQITMNLVINAAEAIENQTGLIRIETGEDNILENESQSYIGIERLVPGRYVYLKISDNGSGMEPSTIDRIFDPYFTTKPTGSGLGLSATLGIVQRYGGGLSVDSQVGQGTTFSLFFPAREGTEQLEAKIDYQSPCHMNNLGSVLVVDDEAPVREAINDILKTEGLKVITANNGQDGLDKFQKNRNEIDLVLLDMQMPVMSGEETFYELRKIDPSLKIILSSGYNEQEVTKNFRREKQTGFLQKPYDSHILLSTIQNALMSDSL